MAFNNVPVNGWPQIKDLEKLDAIAKQIDNMPTFTSNDKAFLADLPGYPDVDGKKVLTATTESGETGLSYEAIPNELPADPVADGVKVLTATTSSGETVLSWEEPSVGGYDYSTTEQKTGQKWIDGKDIYVKSIDIGALPNATSKSVDITALNIDIIIDKKGIAYNTDKTSQFVLPHLSLAAASSIALDANRSVVAVSTGVDRTSINNCYVTLFYTKATT